MKYYIVRARDNNGVREIGTFWGDTKSKLIELKAQELLDKVGQ